MLPDRVPEERNQRFRPQEAAGFRFVGDAVRQGQPDVDLDRAFLLGHRYLIHEYSAPGCLGIDVRTDRTIIPRVARSPLHPLLRFHFAVGTRLAMRLLVPLIAAA